MNPLLAEDLMALLDPTDDGPPDGNYSNDFQAVLNRYNGENLTDLEDHLFNVVSPLAQAAGQMTLEQFLLTLLWKHPTVSGNVRGLEQAVVEGSTEASFDDELNAAQRIAQLTYLPGVAERSAAAILTVWQPHCFTMYDRLARGAVREYIANGGDFGGAGYTPPGNRRHWTPEDYDAYNQASLNHAMLLGVPLRDLDRVLWQYADESRIANPLLIEPA